MNAFPRFLAISLLAMAPCRGDGGIDFLRVTSDGTLQSQPLHGSMNWNGSITMEHPHFQLKALGQATLFGGPGVHYKKIEADRLKDREVTFDQQWTSLVVIGRIEITVSGKHGMSKPIKASRVVYLPKSDRVLIDGKAYDGDANP
jgi:hypothetical protein